MNNNNQENPIVDGIPQDIERYLNEEVRANIDEQIANYSEFYENVYVEGSERAILDILIRRRKFDRQGRRRDFSSREDFRAYVIDVWENQVGYPRELFPGFVKACQELRIPYYRGDY